MSETHLPAALLNRFAVAPGAAEHLLELKHNAPGSWEIILDWDYTIAVNRRQIGCSGSSWEIIRNNMLPDNRDKHFAAYQKYRPLEKANLLRPEEAQEWQELALGLMKGASLASIKEEASSELMLRPGVRSLFWLAGLRRLPTTIISSAITPIIEVVCEKNGIRPTQIHSNRPLTKDGDVITGKCDGPLVNPYNKAQFPSVLQARGELAKGILLGDTPQDIGMTTHENVLNIRVDGGEAAHGAGWADYLAESGAAGYQLVARENSLVAVTSLTNWLTAHPQR